MSQTYPAILNRWVGILVACLLAAVKTAHVLVRITRTAGLYLLLKQIARGCILTVNACTIDTVRTGAYIARELRVYGVVGHNSKRTDTLCQLASDIVLQQAEREHVVIGVLERLLAMTIVNGHIAVQQHIAIITIDSHLLAFNVSSQSATLTLVGQHTVLVERTNLQVTQHTQQSCTLTNGLGKRSIGSASHSACTVVGSCSTLLQGLDGLCILFYTVSGCNVGNIFFTATNALPTELIVFQIFFCHNTLCFKR